MHPRFSLRCSKLKYTIGFFFALRGHPYIPIFLFGGGVERLLSSQKNRLTIIFVQYQQSPISVDLCVCRTPKCTHMLTQIYTAGIAHVRSLDYRMCIGHGVPKFSQLFSDSDHGTVTVQARRIYVGTGCWPFQHALW